MATRKATLKRDGRDENCVQNFRRKPEKDYVEDLNVDGMIILEWISTKRGKRLWTGFMRVRIGISEHGNEAISIKEGNFLTHFLKKISAPLRF